MVWDGFYYLYFIVAKRRLPTSLSRYEYIKVGHAKCLEKRFKAIDYMCPLKLKLICYFKSSDKDIILQAEKHIKKSCNFDRVKGEWYFLYKEEIVREWFVEQVKMKTGLEAVWA